MDQVRSKGGKLPKNTAVPARNRLSIEKRWYGEAIKRVGLRDGVGDTLRGVRESGLLQIVVSDYDCSYKLEALGLENFFDHVYAGERIGYLKPSPSLFRAVADQLRMDPQQILHIGDRRERDGISATGAGCSVLILGENFRSFPGLITNLRM
jgi:putative hydrolase of the HAD superfamily